MKINNDAVNVGSDLQVKFGPLWAAELGVVFFQDDSPSQDLLTVLPGLLFKCHLKTRPGTPASGSREGLMELGSMSRWAWCCILSWFQSFSGSTDCCVGSAFYMTIKKQTKRNSQWIRIKTDNMIWCNMKPNNSKRNKLHHSFSRSTDWCAESAF